MRFLLRVLVNAAALGIATWLFSGISLTGGSDQEKVITVLLVALIFGIVNAIVKPLFRIVTIPIILLTLGIFLLIINALLLMFTSWLAGVFGLGWHVDGFWTALWGSIVISIVSFILNAFLPDKDERR
ncbi:phage holin family protein [Microlunatus ginsengisoli]|uniref:Phage holin family protein n=1 Tax=Microlunatus ginsengisoli TaxID=363863 RepID=A0ABP7A0E9_9ACTN